MAGLLTKAVLCNKNAVLAVATDDAAAPAIEPIGETTKARLPTGLPVSPGPAAHVSASAAGVAIASIANAAPPMAEILRMAGAIEL